MPYGATSRRELDLSGVVVGSGIVEKPSADARRSDKRKTIILGLRAQGVAVWLVCHAVCRRLSGVISVNARWTHRGHIVAS